MNSNAWIIPTKFQIDPKDEFGKVNKIKKIKYKWNCEADISSQVESGEEIWFVSNEFQTTKSAWKLCFSATNPDFESNIHFM